MRPKYKAKADRAQPPIMAPAPPRAVPGGHASAGLLAWVCVAKYLRDALSRLPTMTNQDDLDALTPRLWQPAASSAS